MMRAPHTSREVDLPALTSLRFFAAAAVVFFHTGHDVFAGWSPLLQNIRACGYAWVSFFFVLSGFILACKYAGESFDRQRFWVARIARIYPVYLLAFLLLGAVSIRIHGTPFFFRQVRPAIANVALVQAWWPPFSLTWNFPGWSVSVEAFFYLVFPLVARRLAGEVRGGPLVSLIAVCWIVRIAILAAYVITRPDDGFLRPPGVEGFWLRVVNYNPLARLPEFLAGAAVGKLYLNDLRDGVRRKGARWLAGGLCGALALFALHDALPLPHLHACLAMPFFAAIVYGAAHAPGIAVLTHPSTVALGRASYALYLLQVPVGLLVLLLRGEPPRLAAMDGTTFVVYLGLLVAASLGVHRFVEQPSRRLLVRILAPRPSEEPRCVEGAKPG